MGSGRPIVSILSGPANAIIPKGMYAQSYTLGGLIPVVSRDSCEWEDIKPAFPTEWFSATLPWR